MVVIRTKKLLKKKKKKARRPAFSQERYYAMLVQICGWRCILHQNIEDVTHNTPRWPALVAELERAKAAAENVEKKLARAARADFPGMKLPKICINQE